MTFGYYARLSRAQQAIYRKSDGITEIRLPRPELLHPLVEDLASALASESRERTQVATERLIQGLSRELGLPPVRVEVLAARPHARWGELHGLYTAEEGRLPKLQLWMRTAKQRRVVAFRTYLRTLLHELGHHIDYRLLRLRDSFHTEGFYKRESSLVHQLAPARAASPRPSLEQCLARPVEDNLARMARTPDDLATLVAGRSDLELSRRPDPKNWSAKEVLCHLADVEEYLLGRVQMSLTMDEPIFSSADPERWAADRQYQRYDPGIALSVFRRWRSESLALFRSLTDEQWHRAGISRVRGRLTVQDHAGVMAWHDDNHLDQLNRALEGKA